MSDWKKLENDQNFVSWTSFPMKVLIVVTESLDTLIQNFISSTSDPLTVAMLSHTWYRVNIIIIAPIRSQLGFNRRRVSIHFMFTFTVTGSVDKTSVNFMFTGSGSHITVTTVTMCRSTVTIGAPTWAGPDTGLSGLGGCGVFTVVTTATPTRSRSLVTTGAGGDGCWHCAELGDGGLLRVAWRRPVSSTDIQTSILTLKQDNSVRLW